MRTMVFSVRSLSLAVAPLTCHTITSPPLFAPVPCPHAEIPFLPMRCGLMFAKISPNVMFDGSGAVLLNHDMGYLIPHVPYGPFTPVLAAHIAFSKCKVLFGKATVKVNNEQAGTWTPAIGMFQVCMNPVPAPVALNLSALWTTVKFGFSWGDLIAGWARVGIDMLLTVVVGRVSRGFMKDGSPLSALSLRVADRLYSSLVGRVLAPVVGHSSWAVIHGVLNRVPSLVKAWVVSPLIMEGKLGRGVASTPSAGGAGEGLLEGLSRGVDAAIADSGQDVPPPHASTPAAELVESIPILE